MHAMHAFCIKFVICSLSTQIHKLFDNIVFVLFILQVRKYQDEDGEWLFEDGDIIGSDFEHKSDAQTYRKHNPLSNDEKGKLHVLTIHGPHAWSAIMQFL